MLSHSQNYINKGRLVSKLLSFVDFKEAPIVIEIGPGKGIITKNLVQKAIYVEAIEADKLLVRYLQKKFENTENLKIIYDDILNYKLPESSYLIVANIPFKITAQILRKILSPESKLLSAYLILQEEAAIKYLGAPHADSPLLSNLLQVTFSIEKIMKIERSNYTPRPKVDTMYIAFHRKKKPAFENELAEEFRDFLVYIFERRKPLINKALKSIMSNLQVKIILSNLNLAPDKAIKKILFNEWVEIFKVFLLHAPNKSKKAIKGSYNRLLEEQRKLKKQHRTSKGIIFSKSN